MKHYSLKPIRLALRPSWRLAGGLALAASGSAGLALWLPLPYWAGMAWCALVLPATGYYIVRDALLRQAGSIVELEVDARGHLRCQTVSGQWLDAQVRGDSMVTPWLTVLNLQLSTSRRPRAVLLLSDSGDAEMFRRLRVWLRWGRETDHG